MRPDGETIKVINDYRLPLDEETLDKYGLSSNDVYDLYDYIDGRKKELIKGHLERIDSFYFSLRNVIGSGPYRDSILLYHFSSKRTDVYPTFKRFCIVTLRDHIAKEFPNSEVYFGSETSAINLDLAAGVRLRLIRNAVSFFVKILLVRLILGFRRNITDIQEAEVVFYTQFSRQRMPGFDNVNYGKPFNKLAQSHRCTYLLSLIADGVHASAGIAELYARSRFVASVPKSVCIMEQFIETRLVFHMVRYLIGYVKLVFLLGASRLSHLMKDDIYIFQDEIQPTIARLFNYAYVQEMSRSLSSVVRNKVFVYYLFEQNYGKLLASRLHSNNITVGCQHGTISHMRLGQYLTAEEIRIGAFPEYVAAEGENHSAAMNWIDPNAHAEVLGAPRTDDLANHPFSAAIDVPSPDQTLRVLVPLSLHGDMSILDIAAEALERVDDVFFYIKPHPSASRQKKEIASRLGDVEGAGYTVYMNNVYDLLGQVDFVLFADTSVGIEFAELGVTPLYVEPRDDINLSPVTDVSLFHPELSVEDYRVTSADDLIRILSHGKTNERSRVFRKSFFFANFGCATRAWTDFIESKISKGIGAEQQVGTVLEIGANAPYER